MKFFAVKEVNFLCEDCFPERNEIKLFIINHNSNELERKK